MDNTILNSIVYYLISHSGRIKVQLQDITNQYNNIKADPSNELFKEDIDKQYEAMVRSVLVDEITKDLGVSTEEVLTVVEDLNIKEYLQ